MLAFEGDVLLEKAGSGGECRGSTAEHGHEAQALLSGFSKPAEVFIHKKAGGAAAWPSKSSVLAGTEFLLALRVSLNAAGAKQSVIQAQHKLTVHDCQRETNC